IHQELIKAIQRLSDEDMNDPGRFENMPQDWIPWDLIAGNTYQHYEDHTQDLLDWINRDERSG
ncbi:MAG TPA: hypothetical protein VE130_16505, partial [Nitrososphaeraceae archaeon]|nr:hypothetical protein [Nitrososphaeraceae archaeon]